MRRQDDPDYDVMDDAINASWDKHYSRRCQCTHIDMPGYCPGPENCELVEQEEEE